MPTADEPKVSVRLDFRTHGALLSEAKRRQRKPATLLRMFAQERLGTVERAPGGFPEDTRSGTHSVAAEGIKEAPVTEHPAPAEPSPNWVEPKVCPIGCPPTRPGKKLCDFCGRLLEEK